MMVAVVLHDNCSCIIILPVSQKGSNHWRKAIIPKIGYKFNVGEGLRCC